MYIFELITRAIKKIKSKPQNSFKAIDFEAEENNEPCEHLFLPLDSSNELFACKLCGIIVPREKLKNKNIFENKSI